MSLYQIRFTPKAKREGKKLPKEDRIRILNRIKLLASNPRPPGCRKLADTKNRYRIRVGQYRIIYEVKDRELIILVIRIGHRREVYR